MTGRLLDDMPEAFVNLAKDALKRQGVELKLNDRVMSVTDGQVC